MNRTVKLIYLLAVVLVCVHQTRGSEAKECTCSALCANHLSSNGQLGYYYNNGACAQLTANCTVSNVKCVFDSRAVCESECFPCPPGSSKDKAGHCSGDSAAAPFPNDSVGVHWDIVSVGVVCSLLAVSVLTITGLTLLYKHRNKQRKRSRYIHEVLHMYDDGSSDSSLSDSSIDDCPERNNLFERL